jgi:hypothetical protein
MRALTLRVPDDDLRAKGLKGGEFRGVRFDAEPGVARDDGDVIERFLVAAIGVRIK